MTSIAERNQIANLLSRNLSVLNDISLICHTEQTAGTSPSERPRITRPEEVFALLGPAMQDLPQEQLKCLLLDNKNGVMDIRTIYQGTINEIRYRPAEVLREAVIQSAASIILAHNHPSGDPTPSLEDVKTTRDIAAAGKLLSIELLDHIVIAGGAYRSIKEHHDVF